MSGGVSASARGRAERRTHCLHCMFAEHFCCDHACARTRYCYTYTQTTLRQTTARHRVWDAHATNSGLGMTFGDIDSDGKRRVHISSAGLSFSCGTVWRRAHAYGCYLLATNARA